MNVNTETAEQFVTLLNDLISNGDLVIDAITPEEAGQMNRDEMDSFLFKLMWVAMGRELEEDSE